MSGTSQYRRRARRPILPAGHYARSSQDVTVTMGMLIPSTGPSQQRITLPPLQTDRATGVRPLLRPLSAAANSSYRTKLWREVYHRLKDPRSPICFHLRHDAIQRTSGLSRRTHLYTLLAAAHLRHGKIGYI